MAGKMLLTIMFIAPLLAAAQPPIQEVDSNGYRHYVANPIFGIHDFDYSFNTLKCSLPVGQLNGKDSIMELAFLRRVLKVGDRLTICALTNTADCISYTVFFLGAMMRDGNQMLVYVTDHLPKEKQHTIMINPLYGTVTIDETTNYY